VIDSVLLVGFGGPATPSEIRPFLDIVTRGRRIPAERLEEVVQHYQQMPGGRSPINELTRAQATALERLLRAEEIPLPVFVGQRNWHPFLHETLAEMAAKGHRQALGIILSSFRTEASWDRYLADVAEAQARTPGSPEVLFAPAWGLHPLFIAAVTDQAETALAEVPEDDRRWTPMVFTAHSIPVAMAEASPYVSDFEQAAHAVIERLEHPRLTLAYQSRSGSPHDPWLEPDIADVVRSLAADGEKHTVIVPIGFVCDHVEILYDLDIEARRIAHEHGMTIHRAQAMNDHPEFIAMLAHLVRDAR
jgi:protoporphyrin/coproporphyrin ferrochelatase